MSKFPFVVEPRIQPILEKIGSEHAGYLEVKRQGYLSVGERAAYHQITAQNDTTSEILALTRTVASELGIDMEEAYRVTTNCLTGKIDTEKESAVIRTHVDDINDLTASLLYSENNQRLVKAYIVAAFRIDSELTYDDMSELHPDITDGLVTLFEDEEAKSTKRLTEALREGKEEGEEAETETISQLEEAEKKPRRKAKQASTSQKSTGT